MLLSNPSPGERSHKREILRVLEFISMHFSNSGTEMAAPTNMWRYFLERETTSPQSCSQLSVNFLFILFHFYFYPRTLRLRWIKISMSGGTQIIFTFLFLFFARFNGYIDSLNVLNPLTADTRSDHTARCSGHLQPVTSSTSDTKEQEWQAFHYCPAIVLQGEINYKNTTNSKDNSSVLYCVGTS